MRGALSRRIVALLLLAWPAIAQAGWLVAQSPHFRLYAQAPEPELVHKVAQLEDYHALLVAMTGRDLPEGVPRLDVFHVGRIEQATPFVRVGRDVAGFYRASEGGIAAFTSDGDGGLKAQEILFHEYAHHFMLAAGRSAYPAWYIEGFAEYFGPTLFRPDRIEFGRLNESRAAWLMAEEWLPLTDILSRRADLGTARAQALFYAQSWLLTHYLFRTPGMRPRLTAYLAAVAGGDDPVTAFRERIDPDPEQLQQRLKVYLQSRRLTYSRLVRSPASAAAVTVAPLSPAADRLLLPMVAIEHGALGDRAEQALALVRRESARWPDDATARRALALAELRLGDRATAVPLLDALLSEQPADAALLRWRAQAGLPADRRPTATEQAAALRLLVRAHAADPADWRTLHAYAALHDQPLPAAALDAMLEAYRLAPQVSGVTINSAIALASAGRMAEAGAVLRPLANAPHGGLAARLAADLLATTRQPDRDAFFARLDRLAHPVPVP